MDLVAVWTVLSEMVPVFVMYRVLPDLVSQVHHLLPMITKGQMVTVVFGCSFAEERLKVTGSVVNVDNYWKMLQISNIAIDFSEICEIIL